MKKEDVTKTELKKVAKELNEQLGLEPPILLGIKVEALKKKVIEAADLIDPEQDEFTDGVWDILEALECAIRPGSDEDDDESPEEADAEDSPEEADAEDSPEEADTEDSPEEADADAAVEEAMEDTLVEDFKGVKKLAELKTLAEEWECFANLDLDKYKGLSGPRELRADMLECMPDDVREQVEPKAAEKPAQGKKTTAGAVRPSSEQVKARNALIEKLIDAGKYTRADILEKVSAEYPDISKSSIQTVLTDSKNEKYNKFSRLAVEDANKIMSFKE